MKQRPTKHCISKAERTLFRRQMDGVTPAHPVSHHRPERRPPSARPRSRPADEAAIMTEPLNDDAEEMEAGEQLYFARAGVQHGVMRRLRRGKYHCHAQLDLHGLFVDVAREQVARFLLENRDIERRCVRIIHGKGLRSGSRGPILRDKVAVWLRCRDEVLAYCSARPADGGTGAVYVLLRRH